MNKNFTKISASRQCACAELTPHRQIPHFWFAGNFSWISNRYSLHCQFIQIKCEFMCVRYKIYGRTREKFYSYWKEKSVLYSRSPVKSSNNTVKRLFTNLWRSLRKTWYVLSVTWDKYLLYWVGYTYSRFTVSWITQLYLFNGFSPSSDVHGST